MRDMSDLSERQRRILEVIREFTSEYSYPPTIRQIGEGADISSTSVVSYNLDALQRKGYIARDQEVSRGLRLIDDTGSASAGQEKLLVIPLLGAIAAGEPIPVPDSDFSQIDLERITLTSDIISNADNVYALRVRGNSMIDALINDGDMVIIRHQQTAENGDMVAAWLKDEKATTLKRFYWEQNRTMVRLQPANPTMDPIYVHPSDLEVQGKVIGVIRRLD